MARPRSIIIDCDPGTDDAVALLLAFASPELEVIAVTVAGGNAPLAQTLANARGIAALARAEVPVYAGAARALLGPFPAGWPGHGQNGVAGVTLPAGRLAAPGIAADAIRDALRRAKHPLTLVAIAPATNLALALATEPRLKAKIEEVVLLAGAISGGNATSVAEFNVWCDPEALAIVLGSGAPLTLATIETARSVLVTPDRLAALRASGRGHALRTVCDILAALPPSQRFGGRGAPLYDPIVIAWLLRPDLFETTTTTVTLDLASGPNRGRTAIGNDEGRKNATRTRLLTGLDPEGFFALLAERLARLP